MWLLLLLSIFLVVVFIGYFISKIDVFLDKGGFVREYVQICPFAIVMGETELAMQVIELLKKDAIPVFRLTEPYLAEQEHKFRCLFALSGDDADNIVLCKIGKKIYNIEKIICLCSDRKNEGLLKNEGISYLTDREATAELLYQAVLHDTEAAL